jgi:hypothetical protein
MAELGTPTNNAVEAPDPKGAPGGRSKDDVALDLMKFIAVNSGYGKAQTSAGFSAKAGTRSQDELAEELLNLFDRCRKMVNKEV